MIDIDMLMITLSALTHTGKAKVLKNSATCGYDESGDMLLAYFDNDEVIALLPYDRVVRLKRI